MAGTITRTAPTVEIVRSLLPGTPGGTLGSANAKAMNVVTIEIPFSTAGGTGNAGFMSWVNPESGSIGIVDMGIHFHTTGTGTFDMGVGSDGTGSADDIFNGGTMNTVVNKMLVAVRGGTGTAGVGINGTLLGVADRLVLGPGGSGTNNSIIAKTSETASTAKGNMYVTYFAMSR
jgi:hypothetical protein